MDSTNGLKIVKWATSLISRLFAGALSPDGAIQEDQPLSTTKSRQVWRDANVFRLWHMVA
jgi:hypothetical protein